MSTQPKNNQPKHTPIQPPQAARPAYHAPQVTNLGSWSHITLSYSLPIVPPPGGTGGRL